MCGRTAYSSRSINTAAAAFESRSFADGKSSASSSSSSSSSQVQSRIIRRDPSDVPSRPNAGPGSTMQIFRRSTKDDVKNNSSLELCTGVWGLIPNNGSHHAPHLLPSDPKFSSSPHYKMFNARSETIYEKRSFRGLIRNGQTCILAVDGYYEWTKSSASSSDKRKQPYFVCNKDKNLPLLLAGIWSCVKTGRQAHESEELEMLTTFTILTTDARPDHQWLHPRQPVLVRDISIALEWLLQPSPTVLNNLLQSARPNKEGNLIDKKQEPDLVTIYPVSKIINDGKYQGADCTVEVKLMETNLPSLKSYFSPKKAKTDAIIAKSPRYSQVVSKAAEITHEESLHDTPTAPSLKSYSFFPVNKEKNVKNCSSSGRELLLSSSPREGTEEEHSHSQANKVMTHTDDNIIITSPEKITTWACTQCTYIHSGEIKYNYLTCEVCGSVDNDDGGRKRKTCS